MARQRDGLYDAQLWLASNVSDRLAPRSVRPRDASIKLTENCQARCVTCDYWKRHWEDRIGTDAAIALIGRLGDIGVSTLRFTGGEPLLRRDFGKPGGSPDGGSGAPSWARSRQYTGTAAVVQPGQPMLR